MICTRLQNLIQISTLPGAGLEHPPKSNKFQAGAFFFCRGLHQDLQVPPEVQLGMASSPHASITPSSRSFVRPKPARLLAQKVASRKSRYFPRRGTHIIKGGIYKGGVFPLEGLIWKKTVISVRGPSKLQLACISASQDTVRTP